MKKIYCLAIGNGTMSGFIPEFGANYYCSSPVLLSKLVESCVDELTIGWGSIKVWVIEVNDEQFEKIKNCQGWKG